MGKTTATRESENRPRALLLNALRGQNRGRAPVWLMRQAGRYLPEYRALRERHSFKEMCNRPDLAVQVSLLPHRILDVDALIVFYDILIPLEAMGAPLSYTDTGPVFTAPIRGEGDLESLGAIDPTRDTASLLDTIGLLRAEIGDRKPILGFAGAPFTLASYLVEGGTGQGVETLMRLLRQQPALVHRLLEKLTSMTAVYLRAQVEAGADAVQLFDTWAGRLGAEDYREFALPYHQAVFRELRGGNDDAPAILFVKGGGHLLEEMASSGAHALSLDWRSSLAAARRQLGEGVALQGNLDPTVLFGPPERVVERVEEILRDRQGDPGFIFNLGHGVLPQTPVESVRALVDTVKGWRG